MTKAAMDHYTRHAALQYGPKRIRINSLNPGPIDTIIIERHNPTNEAKNSLDKWVKDTTILQRLGTTSEMSSIVKFLASDDASYVTGACWNADGGFSIHTKGIEQL
ncbi:hypothetical protein AAVH_01683 [Aphelenchoides avenae]|nr:hypothetical protein AAVH_01683 [Aphelenchus avenae]